MQKKVTFTVYVLYGFRRLVQLGHYTLVFQILFALQIVFPGCLLTADYEQRYLSKSLPLYKMTATTTLIIPKK